MTKVKGKKNMKVRIRKDLKDKLFWFNVRQLKTEKYIHEKNIETIDYSIFLNNLTNLYIEARDREKVNELLTIQRAFFD